MGYEWILITICFFLLTFELWAFLFVNAFNALLREKKRTLHIQALELEIKRLKASNRSYEQEPEELPYEYVKAWEEQAIKNEEEFEINYKIKTL